MLIETFNDGSLGIIAGAEPITASYLSACPTSGTL
jgi:hypothetical protein